MEGKISTADPRRAGDLGKGTRAGGWGHTGGVATGGWGGTEGTGVLRTDTVAQTSEDAGTTGEPRRRGPAQRRLGRPSARNALSCRFRGGGGPGGPGRPGARAYFEDYAGQEEGFDGHEDMGRAWDSGGRLRPHRGAGPPRGERSPTFDV